MLTRKTVILAKIESNYGVDPTPTVSADAILVKDVDIKIVGEVLERDFLRDALSPLAFARGMKHAEISFTTELKGTGTRGSLPAFGYEGTLFKACGMGETVTGATSIVYTPVSASFGSVTIYAYKDGILHEMNGCRGSFKISGEVGKYMEVAWSFKGLYVAAVDATPGACTFSTIVPPALLSAGAVIGAYAAVFSKFEIDMGVETGKRLSVNDATGLVEWMITGRKPSGSFDPETVTEATKSFWADWAAGTQQVFNVGPVGATSGNIIEINAPKAQHKEINYGDRDGILTYEIPMHLAQNAGNDELTITIT